MKYTDSVEMVSAGVVSWNVDTWGFSMVASCWSKLLQFSSIVEYTINIDLASDSELAPSAIKHKAVNVMNTTKTAVYTRVNGDTHTHHMSHWTCTSVFSWVLSPGRHPSFWHAISWYLDARRAADKNCTLWQIICRRRPMHLEQLASRHSWPDTVSWNICNTAENLFV